MKIKFLLFVIILLVQNVSGQGTEFPKGAYMNFTELKNREPSIPFEFIITKRTESDIMRNGGSDYRVTSDSKSIKWKTIKKKIYAISTGDTLYINCYLQQAQAWYSNVISEGRFLVFFGPLNNGDAAVKMWELATFGIIGGAASVGRIALMRTLYVLDLSLFWDIAKPLNAVRLRKILEAYPYLQQQYESERNKESYETMLKYLALINQSS